MATDDALARKPATAATSAAQVQAAARLPAEDDAFELANKGFVGTIPDAAIGTAWSQAPFGFLAGERPDTVHPALWRQARLNAIHGLFEVVPGIYQVRGFDISNVTFIEGKRGVLVVDPLTSAQPAAAALALYRQHRGEKPVTGVLYTHSHVDHYGGVRGVITDEDIAAGMEIIAPEGFLKAAVSENVLAGNAMGRRATYMYGALLPADPMGHVDSGLGKGVSRGEVGLVPPTRSITRTGETIEVDGIALSFQMTPDTEAPAEMNFLFPDHRVLCMAENCTCHLHNLYTPRGAQVRDAKGWSHYIQEAIGLFDGRYDALFASHHWPRWGGDASRDFLAKQRDLYKFVHDQTLRLANHGHTAAEIAEQLRLPPSLEAEWYTRGFYGTLSHNAKAVVQRYLGWFDGNPATLWPHPPEAAAVRYVEAMGGGDAVLAKGRAAHDAGDYRWAAELVNYLVFAEPDREEARALQADTLEQLGYQSESGPWRDFYLTGAQELRKPHPASATPRQGSLRQLNSLPADELLDSLSVRLNGEKAAGLALAFTLRFADTGESLTVRVSNAVLHHGAGEGGPDVTLARADLIALVGGSETVAGLVEAGRLSGEAQGDLASLIDALDRFDFWFNIVTP